MSEVSNKTLATLLVVAIVVSLGGTFISLNRLSGLGGVVTLTGAATGSGEINVTIKTDTTIFTPEDNINFGEGFINTTFGATYAELWSNGTEIDWTNTTPWMPEPVDDGFCDSCNNNSDFIIIENGGNSNLNITVQSGENTIQYFDDAGLASQRNYTYWTEDNETGSCELSLEGSSAVPTEFTGAAGQNVCEVLNATSDTNTIRLYSYIRVPSAASGVLTDTITFTSTVSDI